MKTKLWRWMAVILAIVIVLGVVRMRRVREKENAPTLKPVPVPVQVVQITRGTAVFTRHVLGNVTGAEEAELAPRIMAQVMEVAVREGDRVKRGQILVQLDPKEIEDALSQAEAGLGAAGQGLAAAQVGWDAQRDATARDSVLFAAKAISREQWERSRAVREDAAARIEAARAQLSIAEKSLDQARTRLSYTRLTAPFDGVVASRLADPGDLAASGRPLVKIVRQSKVKIRAAVSPEDFLLLRIGQPADLTLGNTRLRAAVSRVFPALGEDRLAMVEIDIDTPPAGFVSGAAVGVDLNLSSAEGLLVPTDALLESKKGSFVFTVTDSVVRTVPVQVLGRSLEQVAVSGSLAEGDEVIVARPSRLMTLADGVPVVVQKGAVQ